MSDTIIVTGASGHLGQRIVHHLLETFRVAPGRIVAASRDPGKLGVLAAKGIETRKADFDDAASLKSAFAGGGRILVISTDAVGEPGKRLAQHKAAIAAAAAAGASQILYTSMPEPGPGSPILFAPDHAGSEEAVKATGIPHVIFRNSWYFENLLPALPQVVASGQWFSAAGDGRIAYVARDDIARAIAAVLAAPIGESATHTLTGDEAPTTQEIAAMVSEIVGKAIAVMPVPDADLAAGLEKAGLPAPVAALLVSFDANTRAGRIAAVTEDLRKLTGRTPATLKDFLRANKAAFAG